MDIEWFISMQIKIYNKEIILPGVKIKNKNLNMKLLSLNIFYKSVQAFPGQNTQHARWSTKHKLTKNKAMSMATYTVFHLDIQNRPYIVKELMYYIYVDSVPQNF